MRAAHEVEQADADEEEQSEESPKSENEPTEEYSYNGKVDEHSYGGEDEIEVDHSLSNEEGDESADYSLYEPPLSDHDSD